MDHTTAAAAAAAVDATLYHHQANPQAVLSSQVSPNSAINTEHMTDLAHLLPEWWKNAMIDRRRQQSKCELIIVGDEII